MSKALKEVKEDIPNFEKENEALKLQVDRLHVHINLLNKELNKARMVVGMNYLQSIKEN